MARLEPIFETLLHYYITQWYKHKDKF